MRIRLSLDRRNVDARLVIDAVSELSVPPARVRVTAYTNLGDIRCPEESSYAGRRHLAYIYGTVDQSRCGELKDLWEEADDGEAWSQDIAALLARLR
jgi:hypothetical protein